MSNSYHKLKQENSELRIKIAVLENELNTLVLRSDSFEAAEITARVRLSDSFSRIGSWPLATRESNPPFTTKGIIPYIQHPNKVIKIHNRDI